jgi:Glyoxalase-like domain
VGRFYQLVVDSRDPARLARFWAAALEPDDQAAEVERLVDLRARRIDIGQGEVNWMVLADPEGNELDVLTPPPLPDQLIVRIDGPPRRPPGPVGLSSDRRERRR